MKCPTQLSLRGRLLFVGGCSVTYGLTLFLSASVSTGAGDGTYLPLNVFSSPLGIIAIGVGLFGLPLLWLLVGLLLATTANRRCRVAFVALMLVHYLGVIVTLASTSNPHWKQFLEFSRMASPGSFIIAGFAVYLLGQFWIWWLFLRSFRRDRQGTGGTEYLSSRNESLPEVGNRE